ncbi:MAG: translocation/assembly module TamB domain-containing protein [Candidatus Omnitrophica bacterium]|nr:translocation/assembly module TamB domain-containing protein [Candidatus Omnitrophota bacterium]
MNTTKKTIVCVAIGVGICAVLAAGASMMFTTRGSLALTKAMLTHYVRSGDIDIAKASGTLSKELLFNDIVIADPQGFPRGTTLTIQKINIRLDIFYPSESTLALQNGTLRLPNSDPVLFYGGYRDNRLDITFYAKELDIRELLDLFSEASDLNEVSGVLRDCDGTVRGTLSAPELSGSFYITALSRRAFSVKACPGTYTLRLTDLGKEIRMYGTVLLEGGTIAVNKTRIALGPSTVSFEGDPTTPTFHVQGSSIVETTTINITLKGALQNPELLLSSNPPLPQVQLMLMLATGKSWKGAQVGLEQGRITSEVASDFVDYFIFGGTGNALVKRCGLNAVSLRHDGTTTGAGVTKSVSDRLTVGYDVEQTRQKTGDASTTQKIGASYKVTDEVSVDAEKEVKVDDKTGQTEQQEEEDKVFLKYKRQF